MSKSTINRRIGGGKARLLLLCVMATAALISCANDIHPKLNMDFPKEDNVSFTIVQGNDPLKIADVVRSAIGKRGYSASITKDTSGIVNGVMNTYNRVAAGMAMSAAIRGSWQPKGSSGRKAESTGTGFFVNNNGTIVTCAHVISGAKKIVVNIDGTHYDASVVSLNESTDLAIIKIDYASERYFFLSEFEKEDIGNKVSTLGYPLSNILGKDVRLTDGLISAKTGVNSNPTYFQMSVPIQPGNSGGPVFNEKFQVVGIASSKLSDVEMLRQVGTLPQNVNFGIKSEYAKLLGSQHFSNNNVLASIRDATNAAVLIVADPDLLVSDNTIGGNPDAGASRDTNRPVSNIEVKITYLFNKDAYHYTATYMDIDFIDANTGGVVGNGVHIGDSYGSAKKIATVVLNRMLDKMK